MKKQTNTTKMKTMTRSERLQQNPEDKQQAAVLHQIQRDKLQAQADLLETQGQLSITKQQLENLKSASVLSLFDVIEKMNEIAGLEAGEKAIKELIAELF